MPGSKGPAGMLGWPRPGGGVVGDHALPCHHPSVPRGESSGPPCVQAGRLGEVAQMRGLDTCIF